MSNQQKISARSGLKVIGQELDRLFAWIEARKLADANLLLLTGLLVVLAIASSLPNYSRFEFGGGKLGNAAMEWKFQNPMSPIPVKQISAKEHDEVSFGVISHLEKRSYRLLVPLLAHTFGFGLKTALIIQQVLACLFLLLALATLRKFFQDNLSALFAAMMMAVSFPGQWGFCDFFCFDGYAYFLIALAVWTTSPWVLAAAVFAGGLSDERVIMVTPLIWLWISIRNGREAGGFSVRSLLWPRVNHLALSAAVILFVLLRLYIAAKWGSLYETSDICQWAVIKKCIHFLPSAILTGLKGGIIIFLAAIALFLARRRFALLALAVCAVIPSLMTTLMVFDLSRSLYYAFPALFMAMAVLAQQCSVSDCRKITFCAFLGSALFPTCYVCPFSISLLNY